MRITNPADMGRVVQGRRLALGMTQAELASLAGVSRTWIVGLEAGRQRAELGLVLRILFVMDLALDSFVQPEPDALDKALAVYRSQAAT